MNRLLLWRDQGTTSLWAPFMIGLAVAVALRLMSHDSLYGPMFDPANSGGAWFIQHLALWAVLLAGLTGSHFWLRSARLYLALPISTRTLWLTRMTAIGIGCAALMLGPVLLNGLDLEAGRLVPLPVVWGGTLRLLSVFALVLALLQAPDARFRKLETSAWYIAYAVILWIGGLLLLTIGPRSPWLAAPVSALALWVGWRTWRSLPPAFTLEGTDPESAPAEAEPVVETAAPAVDPLPAAETTRAYPLDGGSRRLLSSTLLRLMHGHWQGWLMLSLLAIYGMVLTIHYFRGSDPILALVYFFVFASGSWNQALLRLHAVDAWPVPRRLIFAHALLPLVVMYLVGTGIGVLIHETRARPMLLVRVGGDELEIPYEFREIATDGRVPEVTAPWGERHRPEGARVLPWSDTVVYTPYAFDADATDRFRAWQVDRAVAAVHDDPPPDAARYSGAAAAALDSTCCGYDLEASRGRDSPLRAKTIALVVVLFALLETPLMLLSTLSYDRRALEWIRGKAATIGAIFPIAVLGALLCVSAFSDTRLWAQAAWATIRLRRLAEALPLGATECWLLAAGALGLAYLVLQERFVRLEATHTLLRKQRAGDW